jgi:tetratricopeptide (TPR) repeat protein
MNSRKSLPAKLPEMNADGYYSLGNSYEQKMMFDEAASCYREAVRLDPNHSLAHARLGFALYNRRQLKEAEASLKRALQLNPSYDEAYCCLGMIFREKGQMDEAIDNFLKALGSNPDSPWFLTNLGVTLQFCGRQKEAQMYLHRALEKNPNIQKLPGEMHQLLVSDDGGGFDIKKSPHQQSTKKILIVVSAFNRKRITALSLRQTKQHKTPQSHLCVYNDHSTDYGSEFLSVYADEVIQLPDKMGIDKLRWFQFRRFLETDFDYLYLTDNDVIHDPDYLAVLDRLYEKGRRQMAVSLFHNIFMLQPRLLLYYLKGIFVKTSAPGASMFFDRRMVETILSVSDSIGDTLDYLPWDNKAVACLRLPWITPEFSYLEHFGAGGLNSDNYERERSVNPTEYLQERRDSILRYLRQDNEDAPEL